MAYAVVSDLNLDERRLVELTDTQAAPGQKDAALIARLELDAEAIVNGILGGLPDVPFTGAVPAIITFCTACIWKYRLYLHREVMDVPQAVKDDYQIAMDLLAKLAAGEISLEPAETTTVGSPNVTSTEPRGWTRRSRWCD